MSDARAVPFWIEHDCGDAWIAPDGSAWTARGVRTDGSLVLCPSSPGRVYLEAGGWPSDLEADGWTKVSLKVPA